VIRANLLPAAGTKLALFGLAIDPELLRALALAILWIVLAAAASGAVEGWRLHRVQDEARRQIDLARANDARRAEARSIALDLAHLQDVRAAAAELRDSGNEAALQIARVGNAIPQGVWLDRLSWNAQTVELGGETSSIELAGSTAALLERELPKGKALLTDLHRRDDGRYAFAAELDLPK
jgi:Tfp pilus assembly protein PilN